MKKLFTLLFLTTFLTGCPLEGDDGSNGVDGEDGKNGKNLTAPEVITNDWDVTYTPSNRELGSLWKVQLETFRLARMRIKDPVSGNIYAFTLPVDSGPNFELELLFTQEIQTIEGYHNAQRIIFSDKPFNIGDGAKLYLSGIVEYSSLDIRVDLTPLRVQKRESVLAYCYVIIENTMFSFMIYSVDNSQLEYIYGTEKYDYQDVFAPNPLVADFTPVVDEWIDLFAVELIEEGDQR